MAERAALGPRIPLLRAGRQVLAAVVAVVAAYLVLGLIIPVAAVMQEITAAVAAVVGEGLVVA